MKQILTFILGFLWIGILSAQITVSIPPYIPSAPLDGNKLSGDGTIRYLTFTATNNCSPNGQFNGGVQFTLMGYNVPCTLTTIPQPCPPFALTTQYGNNQKEAFVTIGIPSAATLVSVQITYIPISNAEGCNGNAFFATLNTGTGALPIDLVDFKAKNSDKSISLNWKTAEEKNVNFFALERSKNGRDFKEIAQIKTGLASKEYNFTDEKPFYGTSYYRLKMAENDGSAVNYSKTVSVSMSTKGVLKITPSLASDRITIDLPENLGEIKLNVLDISGRVIQSVITNSVQANMEISSLAQGLYLLRAESGKDVFTERFVKQ